MPLPPDFPADLSRVRRVHSFEELIGTRFADGVNALVWERTLPGDYAEVVKHLGDVGGDDAGEGIETLDEERLLGLHLSEAGRSAVETMLADFRRLETHGLAPVLNCIRAYPREENPGVVRTDVYSFHADSAPVEADTFLCTYHGATSEGLLNEHAIRRIDVPETREQLLALFGGGDGEDFREWLSENCYDLHYAAVPKARPYSFGVGNLWRIATDWPGSPVPPCVHRAPDNIPGQPPRLLLIC